MIWNYVKTARLVSLHIVFRNLVTFVITSGETTWVYQELQVSGKLEHEPQHYNYHPFRAQAPTSGVLKDVGDW